MVPTWSRSCCAGSRTSGSTTARGSRISGTRLPSTSRSEACEEASGRGETGVRQGGGREAARRRRRTEALPHPFHLGDFDEHAVPADRRAGRVAHQDGLLSHPADLAAAIVDAVLGADEAPRPARLVLQALGWG